MDPLDNQHELYWMGFTPPFMSKRYRSNSFWIVADLSPLVNPLFGIGDPYRIRTDVNGVRGRCLNHLTNGPLVQLQGLEPGTH